MRRRTVQPEIRSFFLVPRSPIPPFDRSKTKNWELFQRVQRFWQRKVWTPAPLKRGETEVQLFGEEKCKVLRQLQYYKGLIFARGKVQNSSPISALLKWRQFRSSLSLFLSLSLTERTSSHNIGSASALPVIYTKNYRILRKKILCVRFLRVVNTGLPEENLQIANHKSVRQAFIPLNGLICAMRFTSFQQHTKSLFLLPIVFGTNILYLLRVWSSFQDRQVQICTW